MKKIWAVALIFIFATSLASADFRRGTGFNQGDLEMEDYPIIFAERASDPATPLADEISVYAKDNAGTTTVYTKDSTGTVVALGAGGGLASTDIDTSAEIAAIVTDETGTGALVFATSPVFTTPNIGTATGSVSGNAGTVTTNANLTGHVTSTGNAAILGSFTVAQLSTAISDATLSGNNTGDQTSVTGNAGTATALAANGTNCSGGNYPLGVDASGNSESCTLASTTRVEVQVLATADFTTNTAVADGVFYFRIGNKIGSSNLVSVHAEVITAGTTNTTDVQIYNVDNALDMLSTKLTIDSTETGSDTAATAAVINTSNDDVDLNDVLRIDIDAISTTAAQGLIVTLGFDPR